MTKKPITAESRPFTSSQAAAMQALNTGTANDGQQRLALKWIIEEACGMREWGFKETERDTNVMLGRHFVGQRISAAVNANIAKLKQIEEK